ncbi:MAG: flippase-like domain-containing protein [Thermofilaceae archaeon]|nr:flippase-like domain-containing protein [Thermofilaceae archaeon]
MANLNSKASYMLALTVGLLLVILALALSDPVAVAVRVAGVNPIYLALACLLDLVAIIFYALAWVATARALGVDVSVSDGFVGSVLGLMADKVVASASISGEIVRLLYVKQRRSNVSYAGLLATIMVHRFLYNVAFIAILLFALMDLARTSPLSPSLLSVSLLAATGTFATSYLLVKPESIKGVACALVKRFEGLVQRFTAGRLDLVARTGEFIDNVSVSVKNAWKRKGLMILAALLMVLQWSAGAVELGALFSSINYSVSLWILLIVFPLHCYFTALPVGIPAALGVTEVGTLLLLTAFGVEKSAAMAVTVLTRLVEVWFELALGLFVAAVTGVLQQGYRVYEWVREAALHGVVHHVGVKGVERS